jgi:non-specific serine/threonine protein kinase
LRVATEAVDDYPDGVWWVPLAPLHDPKHLLPTLASVLGVREQPDIPLSATIAEEMRGKRSLIVIDNLEQLLPDAADDIATLRDADGRRCSSRPGTCVRIQGEQTWPVPTMTQDEGVGLFPARARSIAPAFGPDPP